MQRIAMAVAYLGGKYAGWQSQPKHITVQQVVENAITYVANHPIKVYCSGRTDSGVHALMQVIHFDSDAYRTDLQWLNGTNANLPIDVRVCWVRQVSNDFHARFLAESREYIYCIDNNAQPQVFLNQRALWVGDKLDTIKMQRASDFWLGEHDFSSFRASGCQSNSPNRRVHYIKFERQANIVLIKIAANAFLYHMVRNMVAVLIEVGRGRKDYGWANDVLLAKDRSAASAMVAGHGLYFARVKYPQKYNLPETGQDIFAS